MLNQAFLKIPDDTNLIFHSNQGWQYQHKQYQKRLQEKVSVKACQERNCLDNSVAGNFWIAEIGITVFEEFSSIEEFRVELENI